MPDWKTHRFEVRPHHQNGTWISDAGRFAENARCQLEDLLELAERIKSEWPRDVETLTKEHPAYPVLSPLVRRRDLLSDSVKIFSAMAVEGFLNYYGVVRLGEGPFETFLEKLGPLAKLCALLKICDEIDLAENSSLVCITKKIAYRRNALVHPRTREIVNQDQRREAWSPIPGAAIEAVDDMSAFFRAFVAAVPDARWHLSEREAEILLGSPIETGIST